MNSDVATCIPVELPDVPLVLALSDTHVYFSASSVLGRVPKDGLWPAEILVRTPTANLAVHGDTLYWTEMPTGPRKQPVSLRKRGADGVDVPLTTSARDMGDALVFTTNERSAFWWTEQERGTLVRRDHESVDAPVVLATRIGRVLGLAASRDALYLVQEAGARGRSHRISRLSIEPNSRPAVVAEVDHPVKDWASDGASLFYTTLPGQGVSVWRVGEALEQLNASAKVGRLEPAAGYSLPGGIAADARGVAWIEAEAIVVRDLGGNEHRVPAHANHLAMDREHVYWTDVRSRLVSKAPR